MKRTVLLLIMALAAALEILALLLAVGVLSRGATGFEVFYLCIGIFTPLVCLFGTLAVYRGLPRDS